MPHFVAVDVETANADCASICQIGIAEFGPAGLEETWTSLVDPEDYFDGMNVSIHGINESSIRGAPTFPSIAAQVRRLCEHRIVVHHMPFDRVAITRASKRYTVPELGACWLDSARVARRAWSDYARRGYGLKNLAANLGIALNHHDALSDAIAAGLVVSRAIEHSGIPLEDWLVRARQPIAGPIARSGNPTGHLYGECVVFTGTLSLPRREAAELAAGAGADVARTVSGKVTILVVGTQDLRKTLGKTKSSKHRSVERLIQGGASIAIIGEEDFLDLVEDPNPA